MRKILYIFQESSSYFTWINSMDVSTDLHFYFFTTYQVRKPKLKWISPLMYIYSLTWLDFFCIWSSHKSSQVISKKFQFKSSQVIITSKNFQVKSSQSRVESSHKSSQVKLKFNPIFSMFSLIEGKLSKTFFLWFISHF